MKPSAPVVFEKVWAVLSEQCAKIVRLQPVVGMTLVEDVYRLCTAQPKPYTERLYVEFREFVLGHVMRTAQEMRESDGAALRDYRARWRTYRTGMQYLHSVFRYLNNNWIKKTLEDGRNRLGGLFQSEGAASKDVHEIYTLGLLLWKEKVFDPVAKQRIIPEILEQVRAERNGEIIDVEVIFQTMDSIVCIGAINKSKPLELYREQFEAPYLAELREYYRAESLAFIDANGMSEYMKKAETRIAEEEARAKKFLEKSSFDVVRKAVDAVLIEAHKELLQVECASYLERSTIAASGNEVADVSDLRRMFNLLSRIPDGVEPMLVVLKKFVVSYVSDKVAALGKKADVPEDYCEVLIRSYGLFSTTIVEQAFQSNPKFVQTLDKALREVLNKKNDSAELLAKYCDALLRKGKAKTEAGDLDAKLRSIITIFKYLDDKDVFQKFYGKYLARRLIHGTSVSDDSEAGVLSHLKQTCGFEYTSKLQRMFSDMMQCEDMNAKFLEFCAKENVSTEKVSFSVFVLTQGSWPLQVAKTAFTAPPEMVACQTAFLRFYESVHQGRRLAWLHHLGKAELRMNYLRRAYMVTASDLQTALLLQLNTSQNVTWEEFSANVALAASELEKTLASLVASKLLLRSAGESDGPGVSYSLNMGYSNKHLKFKITGAIQGETEKEKKKTYKQVDDDRTLFLQALIVRIMKTRRQMNHNALMQEVIEQAKSRFQPSVSLIKKQIEQLIEKEFIARTETAEYQYIS